MSYENWKIAKSELNEKQEEYSAVASWCNEIGTHHIEEVGDEFCVVENYVPTIVEQNEQIRQRRAYLYSSLIDPLHAEKQRKVVLGTWTEEMETEYVAKVKQLTEHIQTENPYIETVD